jgi:hypothetical protein
MPAIVLGPPISCEFAPRAGLCRPCIPARLRGKTIFVDLTLTLPWSPHVADAPKGARPGPRTGALATAGEPALPETGKAARREAAPSSAATPPIAYGAAQ